MHLLKIKKVFKFTKYYCQKEYSILYLWLEKEIDKKSFPSIISEIVSETENKFLLHYKLMKISNQREEPFLILIEKKEPEITLLQLRSCTKKVIEYIKQKSFS
jgi:hypothetical protein